MSANFTPNQNDYKDLTPFKTWLLLQINTWGMTNFPFVESDFDELTNYGMLQKLMGAVNDVISNENEVEQDMTNLFGAFTELQNYINEYFDNLDVQDEIDKKLDEMVEDGTITNLIKEYIDPIYQQYETTINQQIAEQNSIISAINNKVDATTNINPLIANELSDMVDTTRIYVLTTTGDWYYYDGDSWEIGGQYQSAVENYDTTLTQNNAIPNSKSIGDRINQDYIKHNLINTNNMLSNKQYRSDGTLDDVNDWYVFKDVLHAKQGDTIRLQYIDDEDKLVAATFGIIIKTDAYGNFIERIVNSGQSKYTFNEDMFFIMNFSTLPSRPNISQFVAYLNEIEPEFLNNNNYVNKNDVQSIKKDINDITHQYNYFDIDNSIINMSMNADGLYNYATNGLFVTNLIPVKNGDVLYSNTFNTTYTTHNISQVMKYDENKRFTGRSSVGSLTYTSDFNGYVKFNVQKNTSETYDDLVDSFAISKNESLSQFYPFKKYVVNQDVNKIKIQKINSTNYLITFGKFNVTLFKTISASSNANNWNLKEVKNGLNVLVPSGTDIIGPVRINNNTDFIGGVHGDETTNSISIAINGATYTDSEIENINEITGDSLVITMKSICYDQQLGDGAFDRFITLEFTPNKLHVINSFKALKNLTLKIATNGGLIACQNPIIKNIIMNNSYFDTPPTTKVNNHSIYNTSATINTIYGSITLNNIKGWENPNYIGYLNVYDNENPVRNKVYFMTYKQGNYEILTNDIISGEFEYLFN